VKLAAERMNTSMILEVENKFRSWGRYVGTSGTRFTVGPEGLTADNYQWNSTGYQRPPLNKTIIYEMNMMEFAGGTMAFLPKKSVGLTCANYFVSPFSRDHCY